jgi:hypothetical protein
VTPLLVALFLLAGPPRTVTIFQGRPVTVAVPDGWTFAESRESGTGIQTLALEDPTGEIKLRLSFFPDSENRLGSKEAIEAAMKKYFAAILSGAVEREMKIVSSDAPGGSEGHAVFTDKQFAGREVSKNERRLATTGMRSWPGVFGLFTVLSNQSESAAYKTALEVVRAGVSVGEATVEDDRIAIVERAEGFELTVPVSELVMRIPKSGLSRAKPEGGGATDNRRYFLFEDTPKQFIVSGWFESQEKFPGIKKAWKSETSAWKQNKLPQPKTVSFKKIGKWDAVVYQMAVPAGSNSHIRAHWVEAGTWIELHLSMSSDASESENTARLEALLERIEVVKK